MKFFLIALCATVAFAAPDVTWSEDGQYKLVEKEPLDVVVEKEPLVKYIEQEPVIKYIEKEPLKVKYIEKEPLEVKYIEKEPMEVKYIEKEPLKLKVKVEEPLMRLGYVPVSYGMPMAYRRLVLRDLEPFTYHYQQISN